jgi:plastocyanin
MFRRFVLVAIVVTAASLSAAAVAPPAPKTIQIAITDVAFARPKVEAKVGDTIEWVNNDIVDHTATVKGQWDVVIPAGQKGHILLKKAGTLAYYCRFHPNMKATLVVTK